MTGTELHTFVIPAYKESPYLEECIHSLQVQTLSSRIIVTTSTPSAYVEGIANKYQLPYRINPVSNSGIAGDWNFALSVAETPWVTIAHQDDTYLPTYTEQILKNIKGNVLIAFTDYEDIVDGKVRDFSVNALVKQTLLLPFKFSKHIQSTFLKKSVLALGDPICCPSVAFHKALLANFSFSSNYIVALDWLAWIELAKTKGAFLYINKKLMQHRIHSGSETTAQLHSGIRKKEELQLLQMIWGKKVARLISRLYEAGHKDNL